MTATIAEINATIDRTTRLHEEAIRRDAEYKAEAVRRDAEYKARDAEYKARDAEYKAAEEQRRVEREQRDAELKAEWKAEHKKTEDLVRKISHDFHCQWARLVEALCENQVVPLLQERGIDINYVTERQKGRLPSGKQYELDITAVNGDTVVIFEVKTTLRPDDVKDFVDTLKHAHEMFPHHKNHRFLGGMAFLHEAAKAAQFAQKQGLFTILATGEGAIITNPEEFAPKAW